MNNENKNNAVELNDSDVVKVTGGSKKFIDHNSDALNELNNLNKHQRTVIIDSKEDTTL